MVAVVMPAVNCVSYTKQAEASARPRAQLYLIDNGSTDGTRSWAQGRSDAGLLRYLPQDGNIGVARSWNLGIRRAFEDGYQTVLVSNNDVVYADDTILALEHWHKETRGFITVHSLAYMEAVREQRRVHELVPSPDFAGFIISYEIVEKIGWFDEEYVQAYWEDLDYVIRLKDAGIVYGRAMDALVCHYHSRTTQEGGVRAYPYFEDNRRRFIKKWGNRLAEVGQ